MIPDSSHDMVRPHGVLSWEQAQDSGNREFSRGEAFVAIAAGLVTAQYAGMYSEPLNFLLPAAVLGPLMLLSMGHFDWPRGIFWLAYSFLLMGMAMLSTLISAERELRGLIFGLACFQPFMILAFVPRRIEKFMRLYCVVSAALLSALVLYDVWLHGAGPWKLPDVTNQNGAFLNILWPLVLALSMHETGGRKAAMIVLALATIIASFLLFSRAGLYCLVFAACVLLIRKRFVLFALVSLLITCIVLTAPQWLADWFRELLVYYRVIGFEAENPRPLIWAIAEKVISQHVLWGVGPGNAKFYLYTNRQLYEAHNAVVHVAMEMGVLAGVLVAFLEVYAVVLIVRLLRAGGEGPFIAVALAAYVIRSMVEAYTNSPALTVILTLTIVYGRAVLRKSSKAANAELSNETIMPSYWQQLDTESKYRCSEQ